MKRKTLVKLHIAGTAIAFLAISTFFTASLYAELNGIEELIKAVKQAILYALPLMLVAMPIIGISGNKLAGKSKHPKIIRKQGRMKFVFINGMILISLATFLFYQSHYNSINRLFLIAQILELVLGFTNLILIGQNIKDGMTLSGRIKLKES